MKTTDKVKLHNTGTGNSEFGCRFIRSYCFFLALQSNVVHVNLVRAMLSPSISHATLPYAVWYESTVMMYL